MKTKYGKYGYSIDGFEREFEHLPKTEQDEIEARIEAAHQKFMKSLELLGFHRQVKVKK